jgi:hypothetical protein
VAATLANGGTFVIPAASGGIGVYVDVQNPRGDAGGGILQGYWDGSALIATESIVGLYGTRVLPGGPLRTIAVGNSVAGPTPTLACSKVGPCITSEAAYFGIQPTGLANGRSLPWKHFSGGRLASLYQGSTSLVTLNVEVTLQAVGFGGNFILTVDCATNIPAGLSAGQTLELRAYTRQGAGNGGTLVLADRTVVPAISTNFQSQQIYILGPVFAYDAITFKLVGTNAAAIGNTYDWRIFRVGF